MSSNEQAIVLAKSEIEKRKSAYFNAVQQYMRFCDAGDDKQIVHQLLEVHKLANAYFNCVDEMVGNSGLLGAHENALWATGFAEDCLATLESLISHYTFLRGAYKKLALGQEGVIEPTKTSYANLHRMVKEYLPKQTTLEIKKRLEENNLPVFGFLHKAKGMVSGTPTWQLITGVSIGVVALILVSVGAVFIPSPTQWQMFVFRGIFAIALSAIAAIVPGFLNVKSKIKSENAYVSIVAGGAIAVFVIVWLINPPALIQASGG